jgi:rhodanese-related sulfurtransferase
LGAAALALFASACTDMRGADASDGTSSSAGVKTGSENARYTETLPRFDPGAREGWPELLISWAEKATGRFGVPTLTAAGAAGLSDEVLIVDVRETREIKISRISGSLPLSSKTAQSDFIARAAGKTVVVYCTVGWRSAEYTERLVVAGVDAYNIDGGICGWAASGEPLINSLGLISHDIHAYNADFTGAVPEGYEPVLRP